MICCWVAILNIILKIVHVIYDISGDFRELLTAKNSHLTLT